MNENQDIPAKVASLSKAFATGETKIIETRRRLFLLQLQCLLQEGASEIQDALWKDLHKHPTETQAYEIEIVLNEIQESLDHLEKWMKPKRVATSIVNMPGVSNIRYEPLGVTLIIGTWNYPINLLFSPLVGSIAAGNCTLLRLPGDDTCVHTVQVLKKLIDQHLDQRFIQYVYGGIEETKQTLKQKYDLIFCTGGTFIGKIVAQAAAETLVGTQN